MKNEKSTFALIDRKEIWVQEKALSIDEWKTALSKQGLKVKSVSLMRE